MSRSALVLAVCAGLLLVGSVVQSSRAVRFRTDARALGPAGAPLDRLDADIAELRAKVATTEGQSADAIAGPARLDQLADALVHEVKTAGARLTRLSIEPVGSTLALSATGSRFAIATLVSRVDALLESHEAHADRFSLTGAHDDIARIDLSVGTMREHWGSPVATQGRPTVAPAVVATALVSTRTPGAAPGSRSGAPVISPTETSNVPVVRWIGTITAGGDERYVLRFEHERVVAVLSRGEAPVLGWSVVSHEPGRLQLSKEGMLYEVHR